jgi:hypothetical protein
MGPRRRRTRFGQGIDRLSGLVTIALDERKALGTNASLTELGGASDTSRRHRFDPFSAAPATPGCPRSRWCHARCRC